VKLRLSRGAKGLGFFGDLAYHLGRPRRFRRHLAAARRADWIVYAKKPFGGLRKCSPISAATPIRVAIANSRIQACDRRICQVHLEGLSRRRAFLSIERPVVREAIVNFVMELSAISNERLSTSRLAPTCYAWPSPDSHAFGRKSNRQCKRGGR
jgi:hypothetical protein